MRELKNQHNIKYLSQLLARRKLRLAGLYFLRKSHTHDRLDQIWGLISRRVARTDSLLNASDVVQCLQQELVRPGVRGWLGSTTEVHVEKLDVVRNWRDSWRAMGISLEGGFLVDSTANHVFVLMNRKGLILPQTKLNVISQIFVVGLKFLSHKQTCVWCLAVYM